MKEKLAILSTAFGIAIVVVSWYSTSSLSRAKTAYFNATKSHNKIEAIASEIRQLKKLAVTAYVDGEQPKQAIQPWLDCAERAAISGRLADFSGSRLVQIPNTDFSQEQVFVRLERVTARDVFRFLSVTGEFQEEYVPVSVELQAFPNSTTQAGEFWTANLILTRLVFTAINRGDN